MATMFATFLTILLLLLRCHGREFLFAIDEFSIHVFNQSDTFKLNITFNDEISVFSISTLPFIQVAYASLHTAPVIDGGLQPFEKHQHYYYKSSALTIDGIVQDPTTAAVTISGRLLFSMHNMSDVPYSFSIQRASVQFPYYDAPAKGIQSNTSLDFNVSIAPTSSDAVNRLFLRYDTNLVEAFLGFGQQYSFINFRGKKMLIVISEQGIGRGLEPVTAVLNTASPGAGGNWHTSYGSKPIYITNQHRGLALFNYEICIFDLTQPESVEVEVYINDTHQVSGRVFYGDTPLRLIEEISLITGRQKPLPSWMLDGAILGIEGGQSFVYNTTLSLLQRAEAMNAGPPALIGLWIQDWSGSHTFDPDGTRLLWNWELNTDAYPGWQQMFAELSQQYAARIRPFTYINPYISNVTYLSPSGFTHDYFAEAVANGYFIMNSTRQPYLMKSLSIEFGTVDLTNPGAVKWIKSMIQSNMIRQTNVSGFMADFGEYVMFDSVFHDPSIKPSFYHNEFAQRWAQVVREAIEEIGDDSIAENVIAWHRSSALLSPKFARSFWCGDQLVTWDSHDGIQSVLYALFSANIMGHSIIHSDIGGYTMVHAQKAGIVFADYHRSEELLLRWMELSAFSDMIYRSHPGNVPEYSYQVYTNDKTVAHFVKFSNIFKALKPYKLKLMNEAYEFGTPIVRHLYFNYPNDEHVANTIGRIKIVDDDDTDFVDLQNTDYSVINHEFLLGDCLLMAPVLYPNVTTQRIYLPQGTWISYWDQSEKYDSQGQFYTDVPAVLGRPPVFVCDTWNYT